MPPKHTTIYMMALGYKIGDYIPCELTGAQAGPIHHIRARGMGGRKSMDIIENLMALTLEKHEEYGDKKQHREFLMEKHLEFLSNYGVPWKKENVEKICPGFFDR